MDYKKNKQLLDAAKRLGYKTAAQFAAFLKMHHTLLAVQR